MVGDDIVIFECPFLTLGFSPLDVVLMASGSREPARESRADPAMGWRKGTEKKKTSLLFSLGRRLSFGLTAEALNQYIRYRQTSH
jgi:hypothetical protein